MTDLEADPPEDERPDTSIPRRPANDPNLTRLELLRGRATRSFLTGSGLEWLRPFIRTENIDLHTTFPRRRKLFPWLQAVVLGVVSAILLLVPMLLFGVAVLLVQALLLGVPLVLAVVGSFVALPESGSLYQRIRQEIGGRAWLLDMYRALGSGPLRQLIGVMPPFVAYAVSGLLGWVIARVLPLWVAVAVALVGFLIMLLWYVMWLDWLGRGFGRQRSPSLPEEVHRLSMVQALSWTSIDRYPGEGKRKQRPLIFVSSFNEQFDGYVGGFVEGMAGGLSGPWGEAPGFPNVNETPFRQFLEYVDRTSFPLEHSFVAYPHCSVVDIRNALHLDRNFRSLRAEVGPGALGRAKFEQFMARSRLALPALPSKPELAGVHIEIGDPDDPGTYPVNVHGATATTRDTTTTILLSVLPFPLDQADPVRQAIRLLPGGFPEAHGVYAHADSPFMNVRGTHLARLTVVAPWTDEDLLGRPAIHFEDPTASEQPTHAWLLFSAQFDTVAGDKINGVEVDGVRAWLTRTHDALEAATPGSIAGIWGEAAKEVMQGANLAQSAVWANLILHSDHRHEPLVRQVDHRENTVWDVVRALHTHRAVTDHLLDNPEIDLDNFLAAIDTVEFFTP